MVTNNVTVYQFEVGLDEVFADEVRFRVNVDCVIVVVVKDCLFFVSFILCENCEFVKWMDTCGLGIFLQLIIMKKHYMWFWVILFIIISFMEFLFQNAYYYAIGLSIQ